MSLIIYFRNDCRHLEDILMGKGKTFTLHSYEGINGPRVRRSYITFACLAGGQPAVQQWRSASTMRPTICQRVNSLFSTNAELNACMYSHRLLPSLQFITFLNNISNILLLLLNEFANKKILAGKTNLCDKIHQCMLVDGVAPCYRHK